VINEASPPSSALSLSLTQSFSTSTSGPRNHSLPAHTNSVFLQRSPSVAIAAVHNAIVNLSESCCFVVPHSLASIAPLSSKHPSSHLAFSSPYPGRSRCLFSTLPRRTMLAIPHTKCPTILPIHYPPRCIYVCKPGDHGNRAVDVVVLHAGTLTCIPARVANGYTKVCISVLLIRATTFRLGRRRLDKATPVVVTTQPLPAVLIHALPGTVAAATPSLPPMISSHLPAFVRCEIHKYYLDECLADNGLRPGRSKHTLSH
jgi:hypothetical protein